MWAAANSVNPEAGSFIWGCFFVATVVVHVDINSLIVDNTAGAPAYSLFKKPLSLGWSWVVPESHSQSLFISVYLWIFCSKLGNCWVFKQDNQPKKFLKSYLIVLSINLIKSQWKSTNLK